MKEQPESSFVPAPENPAPGVYTCGTLTYTWRSLLMVAWWLMFGGMTLTLFASLPGRMLPVKLQELGASDFQNSLILAVISGTLNIIVCPMVGFKSDRYRSRWGRRIPFILMSLPFFALSLVLFGYGDAIGAWLARVAVPAGEIAPVTMTITVIALVMFMFQFANMYVNSVFWYIFNDIVPARFFGRVMGAFQVASNAGIALFNFFVFQYAAEYYTVIFVTSGILYALGMGVTCLMLKEGEYPPVSGELEAGEVKPRWYQSLWIFFRESCCSRFYILRYALCTVIAIAGVSAVFTYFFNREMGLDNGLIGRMDGTVGMVTFIGTVLVTAFAGVMIDRWHPVRIYIYGTIFSLVTLAVGWKWIFGVLPPTDFLWVFVLSCAGGAILSMVCVIAQLPMEMLTFPKSRFGSFCSAQALIRAAVYTLFCLAAGAIFDWLRGFFPENLSFHYRFVPIWPFLWYIPATLLAYWCYREWGRLGGYRHYAAPASWSPDGVEEVIQPETRPPSARLLRLAIYCFDLILLITLAGAVVLAWRARQAGLDEIGARLLGVAVPAQGAVLLLWWWVRRGIFRDIRRCRMGMPPINGIPHHGLLLLVALRQFVLAWVGLYQVEVLLETAALPFMLAEVGSALTLVGCIWLVARMERGNVTAVS